MKYVYHMGNSSKIWCFAAKEDIVKTENEISLPYGQLFQRFLKLIYYFFHEQSLYEVLNLQVE